MTPTFTGRSTVLMLFIAFVLPGTNARSGMNAPKGTPMNRLDSTSQTEYTAPCAGAGVGAVSATVAMTAPRAAPPIRSQDRLVISSPLREHSDELQASHRRIGFHLPPHAARASVRLVLVGPQDVAHLEQLLARLHAERLRG